MRALFCLFLVFPSVDLAAETKRYTVGQGTVLVDGSLDDAEWRDAAEETGFSFPWQTRTAPETAFWALHDETRLFFAFRVVDADIVTGDGSDELAVARGDRVELFFATDSSLSDYVCFEIDPSGRVLDYRATYYREFDYEWDYPEMVVVAAPTETGYIVEGSLPLAALPDGERILTGVFRAEFSHRDGESPREEWISWVRAESEEPDFHIPSAFGWFELQR